MNEARATVEPEGSNDVKRLFAQRRGRRFVVPGLLLILWFIIVFLSRSNPSFWGPSNKSLFMTLALFVGVQLGFHIWNWRCPACNRSLGRSIRSPRFCPNCGVALQ